MCLSAESPSVAVNRNLRLIAKIRDLNVDFTIFSDRFAIKPFLKTVLMFPYPLPVPRNNDSAKIQAQYRDFDECVTCKDEGDSPVKARQLIETGGGRLAG